MALSTTLASFAHSVSLDRVSPGVLAQLEVLVLDAVACMVAGAESGAAGIAATGASGPAEAALVLSGRRTSAASAALVNGAMLRVHDLMDVYVARDVSHPSEAIPGALACAEAAGASGRSFLEAVLAAYALHMRMTETIPLHRHGLHHAGQAAFVMPLVAGRLLGLGEAATARALADMAHKLLLPEGFGRGRVANYKSFAYSLLAAEAIALARLAAHGLAGSEHAVEEVLGLLREGLGMDLPAEPFDGLAAPEDLEGVALKAYPAQYALQGLIAAAAAARDAHTGIAARATAVVVHTGARVIERTCDPAKLRPDSAESADHSLPFAVAIGLLDGGLSPHQLEVGRWRDPDVLGLMARVEARPLAQATSYAVPEQRMEVHLAGGVILALDCQFPRGGMSKATIARAKLDAHCAGRLDAEAIAAAVAALPDASSVAPLMATLVR
ncbi:MmgE/PrpD family protein [Faunimonas sp. B44]|uniref:MmgE/PrpD family protein n=1 Tax=Faunimonas sp. B44 TaxID=3461493 RepID=UPI004044D654